MENLKILLYPHPILKHKSKPIRKIDAELKEIVAAMFKLMYETDGIGLAANQVGLPYQLFVMNSSGDREKPEDEYVFINPVIRKKKGKEEDEEGCLSFPEIHARVVRPTEIELEGVSLEGQLQRFQWKGLPARAAQHEIDHLLGVSFVDRLSVTALAEIREELWELEEQFETDQRLGLVPAFEEIEQQIKTLEEKRC